MTSLPSDVQTGADDAPAHAMAILRYLGTIKGVIKGARGT